MKTTRSVRIIAALLILCLCCTMFPGTAIALESEAPSAEKRAVTLKDVAAGIADSSQLYDSIDPQKTC